jgi:hypothetical protein
MNEIINNACGYEYTKKDHTADKFNRIAGSFSKTKVLASMNRRNRYCYMIFHALVFTAAVKYFLDIQHIIYICKLLYLKGSDLVIGCFFAHNLILKLGRFFSLGNR